MIYLDNAATTLHKPPCVIDAVVNAMQTMGNSGRSAHAESLAASRTIYAAREALADAIRPAADAGDSIDAPAWTRALAALETAAPDDADGLDGSPVDLRILLFCAFRHDMGGDAGLWTRLLDDPPEEIDGRWRAISARDLYEAGYAPDGAPEPSIQHLEPLGDAGDPAWGEVYLKLVGGAE